jgi:hypothetical protein
MKQAFELRSKLVDGLLAGGVLVLLELLIILLVKPVQQIFGRPGLLVYTVTLMAIGVVCLEQSLSVQKGELYQAWWGTLGGILGWVVIEISASLGGQSMIGETAILSLMFLFLIVTALWRHTHLPGFRYFVLMALLGWLGHVAIQGLNLLVSLAPQLGLTINLLGYLAGAGLAVAILYNFIGTHNRQERLDAAIMAWFAAIIMIYAFRGGFI